ncbi:ANTAR domain-containing protein [Anaerocolumna sp. AGMB13020]|uniref:ANTAR domain-containing response regulator n=1 Tax=Anaerocolumna sp. AGMB13020 TaxID=3081750 RepID=UPI002955C168|nr:ANTAR domain-containing protein [Anaerocolumna sp. AGMB13020]WOO35617.1 ANTAR domain-containing protein [Anaerocolumna sp. AGMB13020]
MPSIIIAFPKMEDTVSIKNALVRNGYDVNATCTTGAQVVTIANELDDGIVVCGYRFSDMHYSQLNGYLPKGFEMLLIASPNKLEECTDNNIVCLSMPIKMTDLVNTLQMMFYNYSRRRKKEKDKPKLRTEAEKEVINKAKLVLMERNNMTEEEAHRYIQKNSMDSGTNMVEMAEMILSLM